MNITDKEVLKELKKVRCWDLQEDIYTYPEDEREDRSDWQVLADETSYIISNYQEEGHVFCESLENAKEILRETKNGKQIPLWKSSLKPMYNPRDIQNARDIINEYKRLQSLYKRIKAKGYTGRWL